MRFLRSPASRFAAAAIACLVVAFGAFVYSRMEWQVKVTDLPSTDPTIRNYEVYLDAKYWQDTGIWVRKGQKLTSYGENGKQPFELRVNGQPVSATLTKENVFVAVMYFNNGGVEKTFEGLTIARVDEPAKLYIRLHSDATIGSLVKLSVAPLDPEHFEKIKNAKSVVVNLPPPLPPSPNGSGGAATPPDTGPAFTFSNPFRGVGAIISRNRIIAVGYVLVAILSFFVMVTTRSKYFEERHGQPMKVSDVFGMLVGLSILIAVILVVAYYLNYQGNLQGEF